MSQAHRALQVALAAAEQLPAREQRLLAERLLSASPEEGTVVVRLRRLPVEVQRRMSELLGKNSEGSISRAEHRELKRLVEDADRLTLENSRALARTLRPEATARKPRAARERPSNR